MINFFENHITYIKHPIQFALPVVIKIDGIFQSKELLISILERGDGKK